MIVNKNYEILTPDGFQDFDGIEYTRHEQYFILTVSGKKLKCSLNHKLINREGDIVLASELKKGDILESGEVERIQLLHGDIEMYDLINVSKNHLYYTNDILSHNCDCDFLSSGDTMIAGEFIKKMRDTYVKDPIEKSGIGRNFWIWDYPKTAHTYIVSVDVGRGDGNDESTIQVIDAEEMEQVAEFAGQIGTRELGRLAVSEAIKYNNALLVIDNRNIGWDTVQEAIDLRYENLYYTYKDDQYVDPGKHIARRWDVVDKDKMTPGFTLTPRNRPMICHKVETLVIKSELKIRSERLCSQLDVFIWKNGKPQAREGYFDDLVMALGQGIYVKDTALRLRDMGKLYTDANLRNTMKGVYKPKVQTHKNDYEMQDGHGNVHSLKWLL